MPPLDAPPPPAARPAAAPQPVPPIPPLDVPGIIAEELKLPPASVARTLELIAEGATVPFMARYRKEVTGGLDEVQLRAIKERAEELAELGSPAQDGDRVHRRPGQADRRAVPAHRRPPCRAPSWRTCTCPTSPSGARGP